MTATIDKKAVRQRIDLVQDPEIPVRLTDLGVVRDVRIDGDTVTVVLRPTRLACPARDEIARRVASAARSAAPGAQVIVDWELATWDAAHVSTDGRRALLQIGYADPALPRARCPYCSSTRVRREGSFGGAVCKTPYSCRSCGSTFDALRATPAEQADG